MPGACHHSLNNGAWLLLKVAHYSDCLKYGACEFTCVLIVGVSRGQRRVGGCFCALAGKQAVKLTDCSGCRPYSYYGLKVSV